VSARLTEAGGCECRTSHGSSSRCDNAGRCTGTAQGPKHFKQWLEEQKAKETEQLSLAGLYPEEEGPEEDWDDTGPADVMARTVK
jgi:hypothetical protein